MIRIDFFFLCQPFLFVYLIVFILAWFVTIIHKQTCPSDLSLGGKCYGGCSPYVFVCHNSDDSWTPWSRCWKIFAGWAKLWYHPLLPVGKTGPPNEDKKSPQFGSGNWTFELKCLFSVLCPVMIWVFLFYSFINVCTRTPNFIVLW